MIGLIIELVFIPDSKYIHNMQSFKGKANIFYKDEPTNKFDAEAIQIFTRNKKKEEIFLGYIKKNDVETIYTDEAEELYENAHCGSVKWEDAKADENWAKVKEVVKEPIFTGAELEQIKNDIENNVYRFRYNHYEGHGYLFRSTSDADQKTT